MFVYAHVSCIDRFFPSLEQKKGTKTFFFCQRRRKTKGTNFCFMFGWFVVVGSLQFSWKRKNRIISTNNYIHLSNICVIQRFNGNINSGNQRMDWNGRKKKKMFCKRHDTNFVFCFLGVFIQFLCVLVRFFIPLAKMYNLVCCCGGAKYNVCLRENQNVYGELSCFFHIKTHSVLYLVSNAFFDCCSFVSFILFSLFLDLINCKCQYFCNECKISFSSTDVVLNLKFST